MVHFQSSHNHRGIFRRMPPYAPANNPRGRVLGVQHKPFTAFFTPCFKESWLLHGVRNARRGINGPPEVLDSDSAIPDCPDEFPCYLREDSLFSWIGEFRRNGLIYAEENAPSYPVLGPICGNSLYFPA